MAYIFLSLSILCNVSGQLLMKVASDKIDFGSGLSILAIKNIFLNPFVILGAGFYFMGLITWLLTLSKLELSVAYPFQALSFILVIAASLLVFKESFSTAKLIGIVFIVIGILILSFTVSKK